MNRTSQMPGPGGKSLTLRCGFRAFWRIESELKIKLVDLYPRLSRWGEDEGWCDLALKVTGIFLESGRGAERPEPYDDADVFQVLEAAVAELGREGVCLRLLELIDRSSFVSGEKPKKADVDPKETPRTGG